MRETLEPGWHVAYFGQMQDLRFHLSDTAVVYAWPSTGGRLELQNPSAFELDLLGIEDHLTESNKSTDASEEDAFALRLRRLGGTFFKYKYGVRFHELEEDAIHTFLGWPEDKDHRGGVWVLKLKWVDMITFDNKTMTGRIRLARTMQERCHAIEMCGGTFHANPTDEHLVPLDPDARPEPEHCRRLIDARFGY